MDEVRLARQNLQERLAGLRGPGQEPSPPRGDAAGSRPSLDFQRLFNQHKAIMYLVDYHTLDLLDANQACLDFYGYRREELLGLNVTTLNPLPKDEIFMKIQAFAPSGRGCFVFRHRLKDGRMRDMEVRSTPVLLDGGRKVYFVVEHDISQRQRQEEALRQSEKRYRILVENARELVVVIQDGVLRYINPRALALTGYTSQELQGKPFLDFIAPEDRQAVRLRHLARMQGQSLGDILVCRILNRDGQERWVEISGAVIEWEGRPASLALLIDVSQRRQAEEERMLSERLQAAVETAGAACHELNQPLQALLSQLELLLLKQDPDAPQRQALEVALAQTAKLADITRRLNRLNDYRTRQYLSRQRILDLEGSSTAAPPQGQPSPPE
ncbi:MAG: PAS domain S-box protein [Pseudomonadota bacterium]